VLLLTAALSVLPLAGDVVAATAAGDTVILGGVPVHLRSGTSQVVTVNRATGHHARVTFWVRRDGRWEAEFQASDGRIGYGGLVRAGDRVQGAGTTPTGTFGLPGAFGTHARRAAWSDLGYRRVRAGDYWVLDNRSRHYNSYRNRSRGGFRWWLPASHPDSSERLRDFPTQYEFSVVTDFNAAQVRHRGGAIFLHVNGRGATAGCVSAPRWFLERTLSTLDDDRAPVIAIGA
jgi:L,D-peptidoglycan transpeptidase YkuD (ErfK/YbiS/YcfS/YnhG family)